MKHYFLTVLIAINQLANTILGGDEDTMFSARCYENRHIKIFNICLQIINFIFCDPNHGKSAHNYEIEKAKQRANKKS